MAITLYSGGGALSRFLGHAGKAKTHAHAGFRALGCAGAGGLTGALLGAVHVENSTGLAVYRGHVPADAALAVLSLAYATAAPDKPMSAEIARNVSATALGVFAFRKTYDMLAEKRLSSGKTVGGVFGPAQKAKIAGELHDGVSVGEEDPILAAGRAL